MKIQNKEECILMDGSVLVKFTEPRRVVCRANPKQRPNGSEDVLPLGSSGSGERTRVCCVVDDITQCDFHVRKISESERNLPGWGL